MRSDGHVGVGLLFAAAAAALVLSVRRRRRAATAQGCAGPRVASQSKSGTRSRFVDAVSAPPVYCCPSALEYNATIKRLLQWDDVVLEVGCQLNELTQSMAAVATLVVGVDIDRKAPSDGNKRALNFYRKSAESTSSNVRMHIVDVSDLRALLAACPDAISLIVVDANVVLGNDLPFEVLATLRSLTKLFSPRALVVKSRALALLQLQLRPAPSSRALPTPHARRPLRVPPISAANLVHEYVTRCPCLSPHPPVPLSTPTRASLHTHPCLSPHHPKPLSTPTRASLHTHPCLSPHPPRRQNILRTMHLAGTARRRSHHSRYFQPARAPSRSVATWARRPF